MFSHRSYLTAGIHQYCTDIIFNFRSISSIKCVQLIPIHYNLSIEYSVQNYVITKCYNIPSYDYFIFDSCNSTNRTNHILRIIVYVLFAVVIL
jgi:hypothetical protein